MARFAKGWVRIDRRVIEEDIGCDVTVLGMWVTLISRANVQDSKLKRNGKQEIIKRGELVTSTIELSRKWGVNRSVVRRALIYLEETNRITSKRDRRGTVITICNYEKYQPCKSESDHLSDSCATAERQLSDSYATCIEQEDKKTRRQEEGSASSDALTSHWLIKTWNEHCGPLPKAKAMSSTRRRQVLVRIKENPNPEYWQTVVKQMAMTPFLTGHNDRGWTADFDWLLKPNSHLNVMEGKYKSLARPVQPQYKARPIPIIGQQLEVQR